MKKNLKKFEIECIDTNNKRIRATISLWTQKIINPKFEDAINNAFYEFTGEYDVYFLNYQDEKANDIVVYSDRLSNAFYNLCINVERQNLKMLVIGCHTEFYMIPTLTNTIYCTHLILGKRIEKDFLKISIFDYTSDIEKLGSFEKQKQYYENWLESIRGTPY
ncbi:hypothetical protein [Capnocytophaga canimorsus]|uniref:hypothetical protein n=1 Tax=Capnocytophaga canimorsus TaxID=28188 RepID=UPI001BB38840|nr:hypothetical protein [Capnocytophaga canimorsus]